MKKEELEALSVKELKDKCKELGLTNYSRLSADELVQLLLNQTPIDETDELDELLDGPDDNDGGPDEQPEELGPEQTELVTFRKNIKGAFGFNGQIFTGSTFDLTVEEAAHGKIKNAIKNGLIKLK
jgi:hypothetical protein